MICGETGIRTPEGLTSLTVFKTTAFNHSAISPVENHISGYKYMNSLILDKIEYFDPDHAARRSIIYDVTLVTGHKNIRK